MRRALLLLLALAATPLAACKAKTEDPPATGKGGKGGKGSGLAFAVDVLPVEVKRPDYIVAAPGTIDAFEHVQVTARVAGAIDRVAFTEGQEVKKGDVMVVIDSERFALSVGSAKADLDKADATVADDTAQVKRREEASAKNPGLIAGEEIETYRTKTLTAKADRQVALQAMRTAQVNLRDSMVRAPIAGIIQTRTVQTGQYVPAGYVMATLLRSEPMLLRFQVEPKDAPRLQIGMSAAFTMRETQRGFVAKITLVAGAADLNTHMVDVTAQVVEGDHKYWLRPGSFCDVEVTIAAQRDAPVVPRIATRATDHGYVAYVIEGDVAHERLLSLGMSTRDGWVEVKSGLAAGELLVVHGGEALTEGAKVKAGKVTADSLHPAGASDAGAAPPANSAAAAPDASAAPHAHHGDGGTPKPAADGAGSAAP